VLFAEKNNEVDIKQLADLKLKEKEFYEHLKEGTPYPIDEPLNVPYAPDEVLHNPETGATLPLSLAVARLDLFCSRLGGDRYYCPRPIYRFSPEPTSQGYETSVRILSTTLPEPLRDWFTARRSGRAASKAAAALTALRVLFEQGYLDGNLLPPKAEPDAQILEEISEEERFVAPAMPRVWERAAPWTSSTAAGSGSGKVYLNIIERHGVVQPIALLTRYALPREIKIPLFLDGRSFDIFTVRTTWSGELSAEKLAIAGEWSSLIWSTILKKKSASASSVPASATGEAMDIDGEPAATPVDPENPAILLVATSIDESFPIDFDQMQLNLDDSLNPIQVPDLFEQYGDEDAVIDAIQDYVLEDSAGSHRQRYKFVGQCEDLTPHTLLDTGKPGSLPNMVCSVFCKSHKVPLEEVDPRQPVYYVRRLPRKIDLLQPDRIRYHTFHYGPNQDKEPYEESKKSKKFSERFVFPQFLQMSPLTVDLVEFAFCVPSILEFLKLCLLSRELNDRNGLFFRDDPEELVPAMTLARGSLLGLKEANLERLEFLGDAHIKAFVTTRMFVKDHGFAQGSLTRRRNFLVSNEYLGRKIVQLDSQWPSTIAAGKVSLRWKEWKPPQTNAPEKSALVNLTVKTIADTVEAVTGACYLKDEPLADSFLSRVFGLESAMPLDLGHDFVMQQCGLAPPYDHDAIQAHPKLFRVPLVESILGYTFQNKLLCLTALTHESAVDTLVRSYERLEFLGDAVLSTLVTSWLFREFSSATPGTLTALREIAICNGLLAMLCVKLGLHVFLDHGPGALMHAVSDYCADLEELESRGHGPPHRDPEYGHLYPDPKLRWMSLQAPKGLADLMESLLGAVYLDSGFDLNETGNVYRRAFLPLTEKNIDPKKPPKHPVQLIVQVVLARRCRALEFTYEQISDEENTLDGVPTHFVCRVMHHDIELGAARARSKKFARREAATRCLEELGAHGAKILEVAKCDCDEKKDGEDEEDEELGEEEARDMGVEDVDWTDIRDEGI
jgi:endoribonuclease Dicer